MLYIFSIFRFIPSPFPWSAQVPALSPTLCEDWGHRHLWWHPNRCPASTAPGSGPYPGTDRSNWATIRVITIMCNQQVSQLNRQFPVHRRIWKQILSGMHSTSTLCAVEHAYPSWEEHNFAMWISDTSSRSMQYSGHCKLKLCSMRQVPSAVQDRVQSRKCMIQHLLIT